MLALVAIEVIPAAASSARPFAAPRAAIVSGALMAVRGAALSVV